MPTTKAGQKAVNKYIAKAYDRVNLVLKKDTSPTKDEVQAAADAEGVSLNAYIVAAISQQLSKDKT
ncbi:antitoxin [uncultured Gemmiger sp.]|uniref:antitoxin n=1 Tax=uncultured Gemmiger sp. TaxID=1623490 RepID=UPI0025F72368|nr:antitoxin [uncultured Gemmiger sp.]